MCGSGPYERDAKGNIDFDKEERTRTAEVIDFLDPNFKKVIHGNFPIRDQCFGGVLNVMALGTQHFFLLNITQAMCGQVKRRHCVDL